MVRTAEEWQCQPQGIAVAGPPPPDIVKIAHADERSGCAAERGTACNLNH